MLLQNDGVLPLNRATTAKIAVLGRLARMHNTGDNGSSRVQQPDIVSPLDGLRDYLGDAAVVTGDESDLGAATALAAQSDAVIVVVGNTAEEEGEYIPGDITLGQEGSLERTEEAAAAAAQAMAAKRPARAIGGDRVDLGLRADQVALIEAAASTGKPVIVVIVAGSAIMVEGWHDKVGAILQTFYSGMHGGTALAHLLFGDVSPSGKLPFTVARDAGDYPFFDRDADSITYGYWHGYAKFDREHCTPRFPFGHGLSYADFSYRALKVRRTARTIETSVAVRNDGRVDADEIVQLYVGVPGKCAERPEKSLRGFRRVTLSPGQTAIVDFSVPIDDLRWRDPDDHGWKLEHGRYRIMAGGRSAQLLEASVTL